MKPGDVPWALYLRRGAAQRLLKLGERTKIDWLIYNPFVFLDFHLHAKRDAPPVMRTFRAVFPASRQYADIGAGSGAFAAEAKRQGLGVRACEHSWIGRGFSWAQGIGSRSFDLSKEPPARLGTGCDLAYCFEVAEHLPEFLGDRLVKFLSETAPAVVFTAAHPGQGGTGHINEQPQPYWIAKFARSGMQHRPELSRAVGEGFRSSGVSAPWLCENVMVFTRCP